MLRTLTGPQNCRSAAQFLPRQLIYDYRRDRAKRNRRLGVAGLHDSVHERAGACGLSSGFSTRISLFACIRSERHRKRWQCNTKNVMSHFTQNIAVIFSVLACMGYLGYQLIQSLRGKSSKIGSCCAKGCAGVLREQPGAENAVKGSTHFIPLESLSRRSQKS